MYFLEKFKISLSMCVCVNGWPASWLCLHVCVAWILRGAGYSVFIYYRPDIFFDIVQF